MFGKEIVFTSRLSLPGRIYAFIWGFPLIGARIRSYHILKLLKDMPQAMDILDVGCGLGNYCFYLAKRIPRAKITGIDCDEKAIQDTNIIRKRLNIDNVNFIVQDLLTIKFEKCYDLILLVDVLEHIENDEEALKLFYNALKTGGYILIHVPLCKDLDDFNKGIDNLQPGHVRRGYLKEKLMRMTRETGFKIVYTKNTFGFFGGLAYKLEPLVYKKSRLLLKFIFPFLLCLAKMDAFVENKEGAGLLILAKKE